MKSWYANPSQSALNALIINTTLIHGIQDYGYPQNTSTEHIKAYVLDDPILVTKSAATVCKQPFYCWDAF